MAKLDYNYISSLVEMAQDKDSNALAELYAATYQLQYAYSYHYLKDEYLAQCALQETYIKAFRGINTLRDPKLFVQWLSQINFRVCFGLANNSNADYSKDGADGPEDEKIVIDGRTFSIRQIMSLPFSEAKCLILHYYNDMSYKEIAKLTDDSRSSVKRAIKGGIHRLFHLIGEGGMTE
ncbi:MAG: sigma-70 family RNA polymerase sigma factor [Bacillota bacterium]|nr:sigma-70 family RNA polymerase sigma factor [Bacillota bacterium]